MSVNLSKIVLNQRLLTVFMLGFASGLPVALISSTLQAWFTVTNVDLVTVGALTLLGLPYTFKFIWAPLMDHFSWPILGKRRGWILLTQLGAVGSLVTLSFMQPQYSTSAMIFIGLLVAFFSASLDIAIDAYRTNVLHVKERGLGAAYFVFSYRLAALLSGGVALIAASYYGWHVVYLTMAALMLLTILPTWFSPRVVEMDFSQQSIWQTFKAEMMDLLQRDKIVLLILLVIFYKLGDAFALSLMTNFLLRALHFTLAEIGVAYKFVGFFATILGAIVGGFILTRWNLFSAMLVFGVLQAFSNLTFVALALFKKHFILLTLSIFIENFCGGLSTAAFFAFLMSLCNQGYSAGQYALLSAIASLGRVFLGPIAGVVVIHMGWVQFYLLSFLLCFPGIVFLLMLKEKVVHYAHATAQ